MKERRYEVVEKIYDFNELSEEAKENARREYLEEFHEDFMFSDACEWSIKEKFPNSDLKIEYSLSSCQGDGFNIYGKMAIKDAVNYVIAKKGEKIDKDTKRFFEWLKNLGYTLVLPCNNRYGYCCVEYNNYDSSILDDLIQDDYTSGIDKKEKMLLEFDKLFKSCIRKLCEEFEKEGYDYFYETEGIDEEIIDCWECNGYEGFDENGEPIYI